MRVDGAVRLVLYERHEGGQGGTGFVLRGGRRGRVVGGEGTGADGGAGVAGVGCYAGWGRHGEGGWVRGRWARGVQGRADGTQGGYFHFLVGGIEG